MYIIGDVIGVGFRAWMKIQAKIIGTKGWVRNVYIHPDKFGPGGGIEAVIQGEDEKVEEMVAKAKEGTPVSRVEDIELYEQSPKELFETFEIRK